MSYSIETIELVREFRTGKKGKRIVRALDEVNLQIKPGELFGLLGPNGAGKTTTIKILVTLLYPTSGKALVDSLDVTKDVEQIRQRINMVSGGEYSGYGILTVEETLWMFSQFYGVPTPVAKKRITDLLEIVGLKEEAKTRVGKLSTGMRQKMNFCRGFVTDPKILFLDEPTLGLDVGAARDIRKFIRHWMEEHPERTILLTTHYMAEADELCDRVAIINQGKILACDSPQNLKKGINGGTVLELELAGLFSSLDFLSKIRGVKGFTLSPSIEKGITSLKLVLETEEAVPTLISALAREKIFLKGMHTSTPSLEDVFITLVGKGLEETDAIV